MHIEFMGPPGSGKTTLFKHTTAHLEKKLRYSPEADRQFERIGLEKLRNRRKLLYNTVLVMPRILRRKILVNLLFDEYFSRFASNHPEFLISVANTCFPNSFKRVRRFFHLCSQLEMFRRKTEKNTLRVFDEGLFQTIFSLLASSPRNVTDEDIALITRKLQTVDVLFVVDADNKQCIQRMKTRPDGLPTSIRQKHDIELLKDLENDNILRRRILDHVNTEKTSIIKVDNRDRLDKTTAGIISSLDCLLDYENP